MKKTRLNEKVNREASVEVKEDQKEFEENSINDEIQVLETFSSFFEYFWNWNFFSLKNKFKIDKIFKEIFQLNPENLNKDQVEP